MRRIHETVMTIGEYVGRLLVRRLHDKGRTFHSAVLILTTFSGTGLSEASSSCDGFVFSVGENQ